MKKSQLKQIIKEEIQSLKEGKINKNNEDNNYEDAVAEMQNIVDSEMSKFNHSLAKNLSNHAKKTFKDYKQALQDFDEFMSESGYWDEYVAAPSLS